jgi:hypothetical protein
MKNLFSWLKVWATDAGTRSERSDTKIAQGWKLGEPPRWYEWNYQENARDKRINENSLAVTQLGSRSAAKTPKALCGRLNTGSFQHVDPGWGLHTLAIGTGIRGSCLGWDADGDSETGPRPVLWVLTTDDTIRPISQCYQPDEALSLGTAFTPVFPETAGGIGAICCDGSYMYVLWWADADDEIHVSRYAASGATFSTAADWTYATGLTHALAPINKSMRLILADADTLAFFWVESSGTLIGVLGTDGTGFDSGTGNATVTAVDHAIISLSSDGQHVYWLQSAVSGSDTVFHLASAKLSDLSTSDYTLAAIATEATADVYYHPKAVLARHNCVNVVTPSGRVYVFDQATDRIDPSVNVTPTTSADAYNHGGAVGFDDFNLWVAARTENVKGVYALSFYKIPASMAGSESGRSTFYDYVANRISILDDTDYDNIALGFFEFDGRDLWFLSTNGGYVVRITNPALR